jgi:signal peptidase I
MGTSNPLLRSMGMIRTIAIGVNDLYSPGSPILQSLPWATSVTDSPEKPSNSPLDLDLSHPTDDKKPVHQPNPWVEVVQTVGLSIVLALGIRHFVAEARYIPSGSMEPTLQVYDRLVVEKISYRLNPPERGDIVVFWPPEKLTPPGQRRDAFIKRVIGLPGDVVEVRDGQVLINGEVIQEDYIKEAPNYLWGPEEVPEGFYLVLGDNRNGSYDGHSWGFLPADNIIGKATVRFWPPSRIGWLDE